MSHTVEKLFLEDAYLKTVEGELIGITPEGGLIPDQTNFYGNSGGQPGDTGSIKLDNGSSIQISATICGSDKDEIILLPVPGSDIPSLGSKFSMTIDWERRHRLMRMHSALHLLCASIPFPVTGGQIGETESRLDFNMPENPDKTALTDTLNTLVVEDHPIASRWITDQELEDNPGLIRTMSVKPPMGSGKVRLVSIGENDCVDLQPCGGTHTRSTGEIGKLEVFKVEHKGKQNRRVRLKLVDGAVND